MNQITASSVPSANLSSTDVHDAAKPINFSDVSETSLLTMFCRALESRSTDPILRDLKAEEVAQAMRPALAESPSPLLRQLARGSIRSMLQVHIALRAEKYDEFVRQFLNQHPQGNVVTWAAAWIRVFTARITARRIISTWTCQK